MNHSSHLSCRSLESGLSESKQLRFRDRPDQIIFLVQLSTSSFCVFHVVVVFVFHGLWAASMLQDATYSF